MKEGQKEKKTKQQSIRHISIRFKFDVSFPAPMDVLGKFVDER
jgi:hypothetical protein